MSAHLFDEPLVLATPHLFDGAAMRGPAILTLAGGQIASVEFGAPVPGGAVRLPADAILAPGFIDCQVNGGGGVLLNDAPDLDGIRQIVRAHRRSGTTGCLPTLITDRQDVLERLAAVAVAAMDIPGVLGFHLEGPALNPARKGIHPGAHIRVPDARDRTLLLSFAGCGRSLVTLAPECVTPALIDDLVAAGLRVAIGHSDATAAQVRAAAQRGVTGVTHLFNAMSQIAPREPGVVGAALDDSRLFAGIICDGLHVDPVNLRNALRAKGRDRLTLVSDAMPSVGTTLSEFQLQGRRIVLKDGRLSGPDGTLAGAHLHMMGAVRNAVELMEASLEDALAMASHTPAMFLGLDDRLGAVAEGYQADLVAFDSRFRVIDYWVGGVPSARE